MTISPTFSVQTTKNCFHTAFALVWTLWIPKFRYTLFRTCKRPDFCDLILVEFLFCRMCAWCTTLAPNERKQCDSWSVAAAEYHHSWDNEFNALFQVRYGCCSVHILTWCGGLSFLAVQNLIIRSSSKLVKTHLLAQWEHRQSMTVHLRSRKSRNLLSSQLRVRGTSSGGDLPWGFGAQTPWTCAKSQR